ncbi:MAG: GNAT family protein [Caldilineaceae bacterium]
MNWENIETDRLLLKGLDVSDVPFLFEHFSDAYVCRYLYDAEPFTSISEAEDLVKSFANPEKRGINRWIIVDKASNQRIGTCGFHFRDRVNNSTEVGYDLSEAFCRRGIMTEALTAILDVAFHEQGINRIQAFIYPDNVASWRTAEKLGFVREGIVREKHYFRGRYYDHYCYSLLRREWRP